jgi:hypothetical protein
MITRRQRRPKIQNRVRKLNKNTFHDKVFYLIDFNVKYDLYVNRLFLNDFGRSRLEEELHLEFGERIGSVPLIQGT